MMKSERIEFRADVETMAKLEQLRVALDLDNKSQVIRRLINQEHGKIKTKPSRP